MRYLLRPLAHLPGPSRAPRRLALAAILAFLAPALDAAPSPCAAPPASSRLLAGVQRGEAVELAHSGGAEVRITRSRLDWRQGERGRGERVGLGFGHDYAIHDLTPFPSPPGSTGREASANGHLHTLYLPVDLGPLLPEDWRLRLQPALAVSSNFLKEPGRMDGRAAQFNAALLKRFGGAERGWEAGLCADHRFGEYRLYPSLAWRWERGPWSLRLGWPDSLLGRRLGAKLQTSLGLAPVGNRWRVHDGEGGDSWFSHEAWRLQWTLDWRPHRRWSLQLQLGKLLDSRHRFELKTGEHYAGASGSPLEAGLNLLWHYGG